MKSRNRLEINRIQIRTVPPFTILMSPNSKRVGVKVIFHLDRLGTSEEVEHQDVGDLQFGAIESVI